MKKKDVLFGIIASVEALVLLGFAIYIKSNMIIVFLMCFIFSSFVSFLFIEKDTLELMLFCSMFSSIVVPLFSFLCNNGVISLNEVSFYFLAEPIVCLTSWIVAIRDKLMKKTRLYLQFPF